jgi:hypothetical protein
MKFTNLLLAMAVVIGASASVVAHADAMPLACELAFTAKGGGAQIIVGHFKMKGTGTIKCFNSDGLVETLPVNVTLGGRPIGLRAAVGCLNVAGIATGVGITTSSEALYGRYLVAGGQAAVVVGAGAQAALHATKGSLTLNGSLQLLSGLGFNVGISSLKIEKAEGAKLAE